MSAQASSSKVIDLFHNAVTAWIVLFTSLILTIIAYFISNHFATQRAHDRFQFRANEITKAIGDRMHIYEQVLWGGVALFDSKGFVARDEFRDYVKTLQLSKHWPGIQGIGFSIPVKPNQKEHHIQSIRDEGFKNYTIKPPGERDLYSTIIYLEPFDWRNQRAFGYDMWSNQMRQNAMKRARDNGVAATSGIITLVQETKENTQKGFLTYLPVYKKWMPTKTVEEKRQAFSGWIYSPFRAGDLMKGILGHSDTNLEFEIFDGEQMNPSSLLFDSNNQSHLDNPQYKPDFHLQTQLNLQGKVWTVYLNTKPNFLSGEETFFPKMIAFAGFTIDLLLFYVIYTLSTLQKRATKIAEQQTYTLKQQKEKLADSNQELERYAYITSHDLQEPLNTINNLIGILRNKYHTTLTEDGANILDRITNSSIRMKKMINHVMEISRLNNLKLDIEKTNCQKILENIKDDLNTRIIEQQVSITWENPPIIWANSILFQQLLQNLIANAIKFRKDGIPPAIFITHHQTDHDITIDIKDNGIGIDEQHFHKIFDIFSRLHTKSEYEGHGMGLAFCKKIAVLHNGSITVHSIPGEGSTFTIMLSQINSGNA